MQTATFALRKAAVSARGKVNEQNLCVNFEAALKNHHPNYERMFDDIHSAFKKLEPGVMSRPVVDRVLLRVASLVGSKFTSQDCAGLTSTDALLYFWVLCRILE